MREGASKLAMPLQFDLDEGMHEFRHIAAEHCDLTHQRGRDEGVLLLRRHEYRFDVRTEVLAHISQLKFKFEVGNCPKSAHNHRQSILSCKIYSEPDVAHHL